MSRTLCNVIVIMLVILVGACQRSEEANSLSERSTALWLPLTGSDREAARQEIEGLDFSNEVRSFPYDAPGQGDLFFMGLLRAEQAEKLNLTENEKRLMGVVHAPSGHYSLPTLIMAIGDYAAEHNGVLPQGGTELHTMVLTDPGMKNFRDMSREEVASRYIMNINPITGKFYDTFESQDWTPGGILMERMTDKEFLMHEFWNYRDKTTKGDPEIWRVRVYGELPGKVLLDKYFGRNNEIIDPSATMRPGSEMMDM